MPIFALSASALAQPGPGFDCVKAGSTVDRLICADPALAALDRGLADRYEQLRLTLSPESFAVLRKGQRNWLATRSECTKDTADDHGVSCLRSRYGDRINDLSTQYRTVGGLSIEARGSDRRLPRLRVDESDRYPLLVGPKARVDAFNRYVVHRLNPVKGLFAGSGIKLDPLPPGDTSFSRWYEIHRFNNRLISIEIFEFHESYFGHGWRQEYVINWDLRRDQPLRIADVFDPDKDWPQKIYEYAMQSLREAGDVENPNNLFSSDAVEDDDAWLFEDDGATLLLGRGERSMAGAAANVYVPSEVLQPLLRTGAALIDGEQK